MKIFNSFVFLLFSSMLTLSATSCKKCKDEDPRARIANNGTQVASVQVKTSGGNTVNVNNVDYAKTFDASKCHEYTVAIDRNNVITIADTDRND